MEPERREDEARGRALDLLAWSLRRRIMDAARGRAHWESMLFTDLAGAAALVVDDVSQEDALEGLLHLVDTDPDDNLAWHALVLLGAVATRGQLPRVLASHLRRLDRMGRPTSLAREGILTRLRRTDPDLATQLEALAPPTERAPRPSDGGIGADVPLADELLKRVLEAARTARRKGELPWTDPALPRSVHFALNARLAAIDQLAEADPAQAWTMAEETLRIADRLVDPDCERPVPEMHARVLRDEAYRRAVVLRERVPPHERQRMGRPDGQRSDEANG